MGDSGIIPLFRYCQIDCMQPAANMYQSCKLRSAGWVDGIVDIRAAAPQPRIQEDLSTFKLDDSRMLLPSISAKSLFVLKVSYRSTAGRDFPLEPAGSMWCGSHVGAGTLPGSLFAAVDRQARPWRRFSQMT